MKVIFLDIDGVLNSDEYFDKIEGLNIDGIESTVDVNKIKLLKEAIEATGAKVVLSSSWRYTRNAQHLKQLLLCYGIFTDSTPFMENIRGKEIKKWLEEHKDTEDYVILDDEIFDSYDEELMRKVIKVSNANGMSFGEGLQQKDVEQIIERLCRKKQRNEDELEIWNVSKDYIGLFSLSIKKLMTHSCN